MQVIFSPTFIGDYSCAGWEGRRINPVLMTWNAGKKIGLIQGSYLNTEVHWLTEKSSNIRIKTMTNDTFKLFRNRLYWEFSLEKAKCEPSEGRIPHKSKWKGQKSNLVLLVVRISRAINLHKPRDQKKARIAWMGTSATYSRVTLFSHNSSASNTLDFGPFILFSDDKLDCGGSTLNMLARRRIPLNSCQKQRVLDLL